MSNTVYQSLIEIILYPVFVEVFERHQAIQNELSSVSRFYRTSSTRDATKTKTQQQALIELFQVRASRKYKVARENGYIGNYHNCVLELLYGIFAADILKFIFDEDWIPETTIDPFQPERFLERLSVLELAAKKLKDRAKTPVQLPETASCVRFGMGPELKCFSEDKHRALLNYSLRELREFGELALSFQPTNENLTVDINLCPPYGHGPKIMRFAARKT